VTYQSKPFSTITKEGNTIKVNVGYSNAPTYRTKFVHRIAFSNRNNIYVFENNGKKPKDKTYEFKIDEKKPEGETYEFKIEEKKSKDKPYVVKLIYHKSS
jgi:hypothetical protein